MRIGLACEYPDSIDSVILRDLAPHRGGGQRVLMASVKHFPRYNSQGISLRGSFPLNLSP
jgi:hypothetical protein